jgi:hypothetical protein
VTWGLRVQRGVPSPAPEDQLGVPAAVRQVLADGTWEATPATFRIIALSHVADGCATQANQHPQAARWCVARALELARPLAPKGYDPAHPDEEGLYASHLALMLGAQDLVGGPHDQALHETLSRALAARSLREPTAHVPSFAGNRLRWPADQSVTLAALVRFDRAHGGTLSRGALAAWEKALETRLVDGLPWSEATGQAKRARLPRGCALSFGIRYTAEVDLAQARRWWSVYKQRHYVDAFLMAGFREWPPGRDLPADVDSGPIVRGVGASATAFGIAAARALGDEVVAERLESTAGAVGRLATLDASLARAQRSTLAQAILFQASHQPRR